jgi:hypothetical protein
MPTKLRLVPPPSQVEKQRDSDYAEEVQLLKAIFQLDLAVHEVAAVEPSSSLGCDAREEVNELVCHAMADLERLKKSMGSIIRKNAAARRSSKKGRRAATGT